MKKLFLYVFVMLNLIQHLSYSQSYEVRKFTTEDGLLDNNISAIVQDSRGFLWIRTERGMHCYDGRNFKRFPDSSFNAVSGSPIIELKNQTIAFPNPDNIDTYTPLKHYRSKINENINIPPEAEAYLDKDGWNYYYSKEDKKNNGTIISSNNEKQYVISIRNETDKGMFPQFEYDNTNVIWLVFKKEGTNEKHYYFFKNGKLLPFNYKIDYESSWSTIFRKKNNEIIFISKFWVNCTKNGEIHSFKFPGIVFGSPAEDKKGALWFSSPDGLIKVTSDTAIKIPDHGKRTIFCDSVGFNDPKTGKEYKQYMCDNRLYNQVAIDKEGNIICGDKSYNGKEFKTITTLKAAFSINCLLVDRENQIWYGREDGLYRCTPTPINSMDEINGYVAFFKDDKMYTVDAKKKGQMVYIYRSLTKLDSFPINLNLNDSYNAFSRFFEINKKILVITNREVIIYDAATIKRYSLKDLPVAKNKISFKGVKDEVISGSIFSADNDHILFFYKGTYIKTDGIVFTGFGKEIGIEDSLTTFDENLPNIVYSNQGFFVYKNGQFKTAENIEQFTSYDFSKRIFSLENNSTNAIYFFLSAGGSNKQKNTLCALINNKIQEYWFTDKSNFSPDALPATMRGENYEGNFIFPTKGNGYLKLTVHDGKKAAVMEKINVAPEYCFDAPAIKIMKNKLFVFPKEGSLHVFSALRLSQDSLGYPRTFKDWQVFFNDPIPLAKDKIFISNEVYDSFDKLTTKTNNLLISADGEFFNRILPNTNIISFSFENNSKLFECSFTDSLISIPYKFNPLKIHYKGICLTDGSKVHYKYMLEGIDEQWQQSDEDMVTYSTLPPGKYIFKVIACNNDGLWNKQPASISFEILPPWYRTWGAYIGYVIAFFSILFGFNGVRTKQMRIRQQELEHTVTERTDEIRHQKEFIEEKQKEIIDSIAYAKRLQQAILPAVEDVKILLPESFIFYQPKDIVAGDFYWMEHLDDMIYIAAADSTGHGVPGAMVSVVCSNALNRAVKEFGLRNTGEILDKTRELVIETFEKSDKNVKDGMDISLLRIDLQGSGNLANLSVKSGNLAGLKIQWSGANNSLWYFQNSELTEIKANKQPIGKYNTPVPFTTHSKEFTAPASFYLFSDGYADQFSSSDKKLMSRKFKEVLLSIQNLSMTEQGKHLEEFHKDWKGTMEQTDDVLVIGIKI